MADDERALLAGADIEPEEESREWLTTFADVTMLLLTFFVLLFSMSTPDKAKISDTFSSVTKALKGKMEKVSTSRVTRDEAGVLIDQALMRRQIIESQRKVFAEVKTLQTTKGVEGLVSANFENGIVTLRLSGDVLFAPGQVQLTPQGLRALTELKDFLFRHPDQTVNIKGYTDDVKPSGVRYADNWEVSSLRAVNVLRALMQMGVEPKRLTATGLADLDPLYPNNTEENRARNRRVEIVLEKRMIGAP
ncbi:OmpA family protein [Desulfovibrio aminophilus]|uniref:OmpA/MotB family protein n=1 Tax=Desulfovibrio aminophilus TaxID=81425 RepID=UPI0033977ECF